MEPVAPPPGARLRGAERPLVLMALLGALAALAWVLMIAAMMLPTTYPVLVLLRRMVAGRSDAGTLTARVVGGFFAARFAFVVARWHGAAPAREAWRIGVEHGLFCVGCCWALMLLMFVVGMGNLGLMLALAVVLAVEKNLPWGRRLRAPLGVALAGGAAVLVAVRL